MRWSRRGRSIAPWNARGVLKRIRIGTLTRRHDMAKQTKPTTDAVEILHRRFYAGKPARLKNLEEARANEEIARKIHDLRAAASLTQTQLARLIGTTASVICRLEDADYEGHSLAMLRRIEIGRASCRERGDTSVTGVSDVCSSDLTQTQLARLIGTTASVICRLEDADYEGHSLAMLRRI